MFQPKIYRPLRILTALLFLPLLLSMTPTVLAAEAEEAFRRGNEAFNAGRFEEALTAYLQARDAGYAESRLTYNIGVTYYKLGRYRDAQRAFRSLLEDTEMAPLAAYNLGLTALKRDDSQEARSWFRFTERESDSPKLRAAAEAMVARIDGREANARPSIWSGFLVLGGGYDSNVILRSDSETITTSDQDDYFAELFAHGSGRVAGDRKRGLKLDGSLYYLDHRTLNTFDTTMLRAGAVVEQGMKHWRLDSGLHYAHTFLDKDGYTRSASLHLQGKRPYGRDLHLRLRYELSYIDDLDRRYDYLEGWRNKFRGSAVWRPDNRRRLDLLYQLELNNRRDSDGTRFISYSPTRHSLRAKARYKFNPRYEGTLDLRYRYSHYNDATELSGGGSRTREENRYRAIASLARHFSKGRSLIAEYRHTRNSSNFDRYDYHRNQFTVSVFWPW